MNQIEYRSGADLSMTHCNAVIRTEVEARSKLLSDAICYRTSQSLPDYQGRKKTSFIYFLIKDAGTVCAHGHVTRRQSSYSNRKKKENTKIKRLFLTSP